MSDLVAGVVQKHKQELLDAWMRELLASAQMRPDLVSETELRQTCASFLDLFGAALSRAHGDDPLKSAGWADVRRLLEQLSREWTTQGFTPTETAAFVFSAKLPLFDLLRTEAGNDAAALGDAMRQATALLDRLGLYTTEVFQQTREGIIARQREELFELSTPIVELAGRILALPLIGTLDSARTQRVMEGLLQRVVETGSSIAIIDITGVPTVDTLTAQHLLKTVTATRLMGADCIISGIRPQIAQTLVHLGVDLRDISTVATLSQALAEALRRTNRRIVELPERAA